MSVGDAYDNAMAESFFSTLEAELLSRRRFASQAEARMACFSYIEGWYNPVRLHSSLGYRSPMTYEAEQEPVTSKTSFPSPQTVHQDGSIPIPHHPQAAFEACGTHPHGDLGVARKPRRLRRRFPVRKEVDDAAPFKVAQQRAVALPALPGEVVDADDLDGPGHDGCPAA